MKKIHLWSVGTGKGGGPAAEPVDALTSAETEKTLEELLIASPDLLIDGLTLVGRQVQTGGGPLDLLGIDADGRVVVFELKRGELTRDAVAQVVDYASDLAELGAEGLADWVESYSGRGGVDRIEDFADWYKQEFPGNDDALDEPPRMVLVGLGVDDRARRMVEFLAAFGVDIGLLTFHAFRADGRMFLARQVETKRPARSSSSGPTKAERQKALRELAESHGALALFDEVAEFVEERLPSSTYRWPAKTAYSFSLPERTGDGTLPYRSLFALYVQQKKRGTVNLTLAPRAVRVAEAAVEAFCGAVPSAHRVDKAYIAVEAPLTSESWLQAREHVDAVVRAVAEGVERENQEEEDDELASDE